MDLDSFYQANPQYKRCVDSWLDLIDAIDDFIDEIPEPFSWFII